MTDPEAKRVATALTMVWAALDTALPVLAAVTDDPLAAINRLLSEGDKALPVRLVSIGVGTTPTPGASETANTKIASGGVTP